MHLVVDNTPPKNPVNMDAVCSFCGSKKADMPNLVFVVSDKGATICSKCCATARRIAKKKLTE